MRSLCIAEAIDHRFDLTLKEPDLVSIPFSGILLERVDDLSILAEFADKSFLSTQTAAENMGAGKFDYFRQEGR